MKYKTLFRVLLKLLGVYFFVAGIVWTINQISFFAMGFGTTFEWTSLLRAASNLVQSALGLYLFFGGEWIVDRAIPGNRPYCLECGYDLSGAVEKRCSECGTPFRPEDVRPRRVNEHDTDSLCFKGVIGSRTVLSLSSPGGATENSPAIHRWDGVA